MQSTSTNYKTEIKKASRSFECRVTIGDNVYNNADIIDIILDTPQPQDGFNIGCTTSQTLDLTLLNKEATIYSMNQIKLEIGLVVGTGIEYILMGYYNIDDVEKTDYTTKFTCYDNIIKFEIPYFSNLGEKPTLQQVVNELSTMTGVQFTGSLPAYSVSKLEGFTCREILSYVAGLCGGNASITREGKFTIVYPSDSGVAFSADNYIDYKREEVNYKIGKVSCQVGDKEINKGSLGTDSMELQFENPWVTESILNDIYNKVKIIEYLGYSMKWQGDMSLDVGDIVTVTDYKNVVRKIPIISQKFTYTGGLTSEIGAKGESKNKNSFSSSGSNTNKVNRVVTDLLIANEALINKANIQDLESVSIRTQTLEAKVTITESLLAGNITGGNIQTGGITGDNLNMNTVFIKDANIIDVSAGKLTSGEVNTNQVTITSEDGGMKIVGATQQFLDKNNRIRIQLGQDNNGDFDFYILSEVGEILFNTRGITGNAIEQGLIKEEMIGDGAVGGKKINWTSFSTEFNNDTNTNTLKSSKILLDGTSQTLDIHFNKLENKVEENIETTISNTTQLNIADGKINTLIQDTTIIKDGETIKLVDDYNRTTQTVSSMNSTIGNHTSQINEATGQIISVNTRISTVERDLNGLSSKVSATETNLNNNYSTTSAMNSAINQSASSIRGEVSNTYVTNNTANNIFATKASMELTSNQLRLDFSQSGGFNILKNSAFNFNGDLTKYWGIHKYGNTGNGNAVLIPSSYDWGFPDNEVRTIQITATNITAQVGFIQDFNTEIGKEYTLTIRYSGHRITQGYIGIRNATNYNFIATKYFNPMDYSGGKNSDNWGTLSLTFKADSRNMRVDLLGTHFQSDGFLWFAKPMISAGKEGSAWTNNKDEIQSGSTFIDGSGVTILNGALRVKNNDGKEVITADSKGNLVISGNATINGRLQPSDNIVRLFGNDCRIDGSGTAIRLQVNPHNYVSVDGTATRFFNSYSQSGTKYTSIYTDWEGHSQIFAGSSCVKLLSSGSAAVQSRWANVEQYAPMAASEYRVGSLRAYKENIHDPTEINFMKILIENDIKAYNLVAEVEHVNKTIPGVVLPNGKSVVKVDLKTGLILDDLTEEAKEILNPSGEDTIALYPMLSTLWKVCQEQQKRIEMLEESVFSTRVKNIWNNCISFCKCKFKLV